MTDPNPTPNIVSTNLRQLTVIFVWTFIICALWWNYSSWIEPYPRSVVFWPTVLATSLAWVAHLKFKHHRLLGWLCMLPFMLLLPICLVAFIAPHLFLY